MVSVSHVLTVQTGEVELLSTKWNPEEVSIAVGCSDGNARVYSADGSLINTLLCHEGIYYPVTSVRWKPGNTKTKNILLGATCEGRIYHYHVSSGKIIYSTCINAGILCSDYSEDGSYYTLGCDDNSVRLYDENTKGLLRTYNDESQGLHHTSRVMCIKWSSPNTFWSGGWDKNVICWDIRSNRSAHHIYGPKICGEALDFYNSSIFTGSYEVENQLCIWDQRNLKPIHSLNIGEPGERCLVYTIQISKSSQSKILAVGGSGKNVVYFYDLESLHLDSIISSITKPVYSVDFSNKSDLLSVVGGDGSMRVFATRGE